MLQRRLLLLSSSLWTILSSPALAGRDYEAIAADPDRLFENNLIGAVLVIGMVGAVVSFFWKLRPEKKEFLVVPLASGATIDPAEQGVPQPESVRPEPQAVGCWTYLLALFLVPMMLSGFGGAFVFVQEGQILPAITSLGVGLIASTPWAMWTWAYFQRRR